MLNKIDETREPRAVKELETQQMPLPELSPEIAQLALLNLIYERVILEEGRSPNFYIFERDLAAGVTLMTNADFNPDRWVIWFRVDPLVTLRIFPGESVPAQGAIEIVSGQMAVISNRSNVISFENTGTSQTAGHIFAVAIGGGAEFSILAI